jgi:hypothetical protein
MTPTDPRVRRFLARSMIARTVARGPDQRPFITPYWFVTDGDRICITTGRAALLARYVAADPRVVLLFEADRHRVTGSILRMTGLARVHDGLPLRLVLRSTRKYILSLGGLRSELSHLRLLGLRRRYYAQSEPAWIEVTPDTATFVPAPSDEG